MCHDAFSSLSSVGLPISQLPTTLPFLDVEVFIVANDRSFTIEYHEMVDPDI